MSTKSIGSTLAATLSGPLVAAGIILGSLVVVDPAPASAQPTSDGQCATMPMTGGQDQSAPSALTRAGQVGSANGPIASDPSMTVTCQAASHG